MENGEILSWAVYRYISIGNILCRLLVVTLQHIVTVDPTDGRITAKYPTPLVSTVSWDKNTDQLFRIIFKNGFQLIMLSDDRFQIIKSLVGFSKIRNSGHLDDDSAAFIPTELDCECDFLVQYIDFSQKATRVSEVISLGAHTIQHMDAASPYRVFRKVPYTQVQKLTFPDDPAFPHLVVILYVNETSECAYQVNPTDFIKFITLLQARVHFHYFLTKSNLDKVNARDVDDPHVDFNKPQTQNRNPTLPPTQPPSSSQNTPPHPSTQARNPSPQPSRGRSQSPAKNAEPPRSPHPHSQQHKIKQQEELNQRAALLRQQQPQSTQIPQNPQNSQPSKFSQPSQFSQPPQAQPSIPPTSARPPSPYRPPSASTPVSSSPSPSPPSPSPVRPPSPFPTRAPSPSPARPPSPSPARPSSPVQPIPPLQSQQPIQPPNFTRQNRLRSSWDDSLEANLASTTEKLALSDLKPNASKTRPASPAPGKRQTDNNHNGADPSSIENAQPKRRSSILESQSGHVVTLMKGSYLSKYTKHGKGKPHKRYFRLNPIVASLSWSESEGSAKSKIAQVTGVLYGEALRGIKTTEEFPFSLVTPKRTLDLAASNLQDFQMWTEGVAWVLANLDQKPGV